MELISKKVENQIILKMISYKKALQILEKNIKIKKDWESYQY